MKNINLLIIIFFFICIKAYSQGSKLYKQDPASVSDFLTDEEIKKLLTDNFSKILSGQSTSSPGKFASLDIEKTDVTFAPSILLNDRNIFSMKFKGGVTEGVSSMFNNSKLNTNISVELQYNLMLGKRKETVNYYVDDYSTLLAALIRKQILVFNQYKSFAATHTISNNTMDAEIAKVVALEAKDLTTLSIIELDNEYNNMNACITSFKAQIKANVPTAAKANFSILQLNMNNILNSEKSEQLEKFDISAFTLNWITFGYKIRNDDFRILNAEEAYENEIMKTNFVSHEVNAQYSHYHFSENDNNIYYAVALAYQYRSNYLDLNKNTVVESTETDISGDSRRETTNTFVAYSGDYIAGLSEANIRADLYYFFSKYDFFGVHIFQNSRFVEYIKPAYDLGIGIVIPFKEKGKEKSIINAELYYNIKNIFNTTDTSYAFIERNDIGLRFTFPINFK